MAKKIALRKSSSLRTCAGRSKPSGEIGIRTRDAGFPTYRISNPALDSRNRESPQGLATPGEAVLPTSLPFSVENYPALRAVVEAWPTLPDHVRATIAMIVTTAIGTGAWPPLSAIDFGKNAGGSGGRYGRIWKRQLVSLAKQQSDRRGFTDRLYQGPSGAAFRSGPGLAQLDPAKRQIILDRIRRAVDRFPANHHAALPMERRGGPRDSRARPDNPGAFRGDTTVVHVSIDRQRHCVQPPMRQAPLAGRSEILWLPKVSQTDIRELPRGPQGGQARALFSAGAERSLARTGSKVGKGLVDSGAPGLQTLHLKRDWGR